MLEIQSISKTYQTRKGPVSALNNVSLSVGKGEFIIIRGPSGCGKTTMLLLAGGMLNPTSGKMTFEGEDLYAMPPHQRAAFRAVQIGFVFQMFHLVHYLNVLDNVRLAIKNGNAQNPETLLATLGLSHRLSHTPAELSAGEKQRTAIARALVNNPSLVLADEPTGNLDPDNAREIYNHLHAYQQQGGTVLVVTHGHLGDEYATRVIQMDQGKIVNQ